MANQPFDPRNPVYPPRCYAVHTPNKTSFRKPNLNIRPEINFNMLMYLSPNPENGKLQVVDDQCIRDIIRSSETPWEPRLQRMLMYGYGTADFVPAHLPNLIDLAGVVDVREIFNKLNDEDNKEELTYNPRDVSEVIPDFLLNIIDPTPVFAIEGPVYPLTTREVTTELACYSDGFQVFYLHSDISEITVRLHASRIWIEPFIRFMDVTLLAKYEQDSLVFPLGASIVVWNARGVSRPSFKSNILQIVAVHKPIIFIITEARIGLKSFKEVVKAIHFEVDYFLDESVGNAGGVAVIWNDNKVKSGQCVIANTDMDSSPIRMLVELKVANATATATEEGVCPSCMNNSS